MDDDDKKVIATIGIDSDGDPVIPEPIFISLTSFKTKKYLDIRKRYSKDGEWMPTKKGITLALDQYNELKKALEDNSEEILKWLD